MSQTEYPESAEAGNRFLDRGPATKPTTGKMWTRDDGGEVQVGPPPAPTRPAIGRDHDGVLAALNLMRIDVRRNSRSQDVEYHREKAIPANAKISHLPAGKWVPATDDAESAIRTAIQEQFSFRSGNPAHFGDDTYQDSIRSIVFGRLIDPFVLWLEDLPKWDGKGRIETMWDEAFLVESGPLEWAAAKFLIAAIYRTMDGAYQHDFLPLLVGRQGCGKSTFCRGLVPTGDGWFVDSVDLSAQRREVVEATLGSVIVEFSELVGIRRAEVTRLKSLLSGVSDKVRLSYRRNAQEYPRQWIPVGTANQADHGVLPHDPSGQRRYAVVEIPDAATPERVRAYLAENRDQLWAEALVRYRAGESTHPSPEVEVLANAAASRHVVQNDAFEDCAIELALKYLDPEEGHTMTDLLIESGLAVDRAKASKQNAAQRSLGSELRAQGWVKRQRKAEDKKVRMMWFPSVPIQPMEVQPGIETRGLDTQPLFEGRQPATWEEQKIAIKSCIHPTCPTCTRYHRTWDSQGQLFSNGREH